VPILPRLGDEPNPQPAEASRTFTERTRYLAARLLRQIQYYERAIKLCRELEKHEAQEEEAAYQPSPRAPAFDPDLPF
jgi:hypothetical protein